MVVGVRPGPQFPLSWVDPADPGWVRDDLSAGSWQVCSTLWWPRGWLGYESGVPHLYANCAGFELEPGGEARVTIPHDPAHAEPLPDSWYPREPSRSSRERSFW